LGIRKGIKRAVAFEFQSELQRILGINYTVDTKEIDDPRQRGFYVRMLKDDRPIEAIPIFSDGGMEVGTWTSRSHLKEEDEIKEILCKIVEKYSKREGSS
jgi:hypothetical protein